MSSLETIKQELIEQKKLIEKRGGVVSVANDYPSPSEITEGIKTVEGIDFSLATATEADVMLGKTFFGSTPGLKTGKGDFDVETQHHLFVYPELSRSTEEDVYYSFPSYITKARKYLFYKNVNSIHITFNENATVIEEYAFYSTHNATFYNFEGITQLNRISGYAFYDSGIKGINLWDYPPALRTVEGYAFQNTIKENTHLTDIRVPASITSLGIGAYRQDTRKSLHSLDISNTSLTILADYMVYNISFNCDLVIPSTVTEVGDYFNFGGTFNNITIPGGINLRPNAFYALTTDALNLFKLKTVTFEGTTMGTVGSRVFAKQNITNGFKIYVPDEALDYYKSISNLSDYYSCMYPMSEKD